MTVPPFTTLEERWPQTRMFVIGGGTSLSKFDFKSLRGKGIVIGANKSAFCADADVLVSVDQKFANKYRSDIVSFVKEKKLAVLAMPINDLNHVPIPGAIYVMRDRGNGLSRNRERIRAIHTGMGCIGAAYHLGANRIDLLGMDMKTGADGSTHFHGGYTNTNREVGRFMRKWATGGGMEAVAVQCDMEGIKVTNWVGPIGSEISCFEKRDLRELEDELGHVGT